MFYDYPRADGAQKAKEISRKPNFDSVVKDIREMIAELDTAEQERYRTLAEPCIPPVNPEQETRLAHLHHTLAVKLGLKRDLSHDKSIWDEKGLLAH